MELLAPVGTLENFQAAMDAGADAVYVGAPGFNARNLARDLGLEEVGAMIRHCHDRGKKLYVAANSLILESEIPRAIETLALLESLGPDALIVQDLGLIRLVREYFPALPLHASTLMVAHNADAVRMLASLGCRRVVLARELTIKEIAAVAAAVDTPLEVFVQGAMCFSYSGLCLFSSYLGGKSGLRGRCVQPCRRRYNWQSRDGKGGGGKTAGGSYLFSMNDLSGLEAVPALRRIGVAALKIEGRLRSAHYVSHVVRAYRLLLDSAEGDFEQAVEGAKVLIDRAMGRKVSPGFFLSPQPKEAISPYHSGNTGLHLGRLKILAPDEAGVFGSLALKGPVGLGDRLRLHFESSGERQAFSLKRLMLRNQEVEEAEAGTPVRILLPEGSEKLSGRIELYKVDVRQEKAEGRAPDLAVAPVKRDLGKSRNRLGPHIQSIQARVLGTEEAVQTLQGGNSPGRGRKSGPQKKSGSGLPVEWWLKTDQPGMILGRLPFAPDRLLLTLDKNMLGQAGRIRQYLGAQARNVIWALPPVLLGAEFQRLRSSVHSLMRSGFKSFQIGHLSQTAFFGKERVHLYGDYTLNLMNGQAVELAGIAGLEAVQLSIELDQQSLQDCVKGYRRPGIEDGKGTSGGRVRLGLMVYGAPALFTARLAADHFQYGRIFISPKEEPFVIRKKEGGTQTFATRPFSLLPHLQDLKEMGLQYVVIDTTGLALDKKGLQELADRMSAKGRGPRLSAFNYFGKLE
ncbi:MAG: U32 family peptidase [Desulfocapsaceae bacterium]|nr:U32 family peptidase [Desulfocapsaceae bacterium]